MFSIRRFVRPVAVSLALALAAAPAVAFAGSNDKGGEMKREHVFPMTAENFSKLVEKRISKGRERLAKKLEKHNLPDATKAAAKKDFEDGATAVRALAAKVQADGTVTKDEAKQVRALAKDLKQKAREKYGFGKGKRKGNDKTKGQV